MKIQKVIEKTNQLLKDSRYCLRGKSAQTSNNNGVWVN